MHRVNASGIVADCNVVVGRCFFRCFPKLCKEKLPGGSYVSTKLEQKCNGKESRMSSLNKAMIIGRLGQDPEVRYTQSNTAVATLNVATNERYKDRNGEFQEKTDWHRVVAWGRTAEICQEYLKKGSQVYIEGPIQTREWEDKDGQKRYTTEIKALTLTMLDTPGGRQGGGMAGGGEPAGRSKKSNESVELDNSFDDMDDDLPF